MCYRREMTDINMKHIQYQQNIWKHDWYCTYNPQLITVKRKKYTKGCFMTQLTHMSLFRLCWSLIVSQVIVTLYGQEYWTNPFNL